MVLLINSLLACLVVGFLSHSQGLQFTLDSTPDTFYCGHLNCTVDVNQNDPRILSVVGLSISNIAESNTLIRLASVSVVDPVPHVEPTKVNVINATGSVSPYHGNLLLALRSETDCTSGSFVCELDFVNVTGKSDMITEVVTPVNTGNCQGISRELTNMADKLDKHSDDVDRQLTELKSQNADLDGKLTELKSQNAVTEQELASLKDLNVAMETKLDSVLGYLSRLEGKLNTSQHTEWTVSCVKGEQQNETRVKFWLWGRVPALCDTETDGGGWVIIQRRTTGDVDFYKGWDDYKKGFGTPDTDYWLGNDNIHNLTSQGYTNLRVDMEYQGVKYFAEYSTFSVADEISKYKLTVGGYHGTAGDGLTYNSGMFFSTFDNDNDDTIHLNCAAADDFHGAWWYKSCSLSNLNGFWGAQNKSGLIWLNVLNPRSLTWSEMKIRQV